jgi:hypothetical protein
MSLINDALRRAGDADRKRRKPPPPTPTLEPVQPKKPGSHGLVWLAGLLILTLALGGVIVWRGTQNNPRIARSPRETAAPSLRSTNSPPTRVNTALPGSQPVATQPPAAPVPTIKVNTNVTLRENSTTTPPATIPETADDTAPQYSPTPQDRVIPNTNDVTAGSSPETPAFPELKLQSIIYRERNPAALINGQMVGVNDVVSGATIKDIERQRVTVEWNGSNRALTLPRF